MSTEYEDTRPDTPPLFDEFEDWVEQHGGRVLSPYDAPVAVMPTEFFDEEDIPDVDMAPALIDRDGEKQLTPPFWWQAQDLQGITLLAREHIAYMWVTSSEEKLLTEAMLRRKADHPLPPIVKRAVRRAGGVNE